MMAGKMTKNQMIMRVRGRMKVVGRGDTRSFPYTKWISKHEHILVDVTGTYYLDTRTGTRRYNELRFMNKTQIENILRRLK